MSRQYILSMLGWTPAECGEKDLRKEYENAVEQYMDKLVNTRGYNSVESCIGKYSQSPNPKYKAEAERVNVWNTACWLKCHEILNKVESGEMALPTIEEVFEMLPKLDWDDIV